MNKEIANPANKAEFETKKTTSQIILQELETSEQSEIIEDSSVLKTLSSEPGSRPQV